MALLEFWNGIHDAGQVTVDPPDLSVPLNSAQDPALLDAVAEADARRRLEMAGEAPALQPVATLWAIELAYRACQFLVFREVESPAITEALAKPCPMPWSAEVCYSVDLALCVMPDLLRLARAASPDDPLVAALMILARQWPLSSVGEAIQQADISPFIEHPSLRALYVDRILQRGDRSRLDDPRIVAEIRRVIAGQPGLSPVITNALKEVA